MTALQAPPLRVIFRGFMLVRREDGPLLQLARLALIVAALDRCGGPRGGLARRRRRGPSGPKSGRRRPGASRFPDLTQSNARRAPARAGSPPCPRCFKDH